MHPMKLRQVNVSHVMVILTRLFSFVQPHSEVKCLKKREQHLLTSITSYICYKVLVGSSRRRDNFTYREEKSSTDLYAERKR